MPGAFRLTSQMPADPHPSLDPYREAVEREGPTFDALLWRSPEYQRRRFEVIAQSLDLTGRVVADIGCGRADLLAFLHSLGVEYGGYVGVDGLIEMVEHSRTRAGRDHLEEARFIHADFATDEQLFERLVSAERADVFAFSGSLNTFDEMDARAVLDRAWSALTADRRPGRALIFNFLSDAGGTAGEDLGPSRRFHTASFAAWALDRTPRIILRTDYLPSHDATIAMLTT